MGTFLFEAPVFGPIKSRRLGVSLGINLLPDNGKVCSYDCLYCECGLNAERRSPDNTLPARKDVKARLEERLQEMRANNEALNVITFAGNGEPTLHPDFKSIVEDVISLKDKYYPAVKISVLSNAAHLDKGSVIEALRMIDNNILKLDSAVESTFQAINQPNNSIHIAQIIQNLCKFGNGVIIQTLFCKGEYAGVSFDNTSDSELEALIQAYKRINPEAIMIYSLSRDTPVNSIYKVDVERLNVIAEKLRAEGFKVDVA